MFDLSNLRDRPLNSSKFRLDTDRIILLQFSYELLDIVSKPIHKRICIATDSSRWNCLVSTTAST